MAMRVLVLVLVLPLEASRVRFRIAGVVRGDAMLTEGVCVCTVQVHYVQRSEEIRRVYIPGTS